MTQKQIKSHTKDLNHAYNKLVLDYPMGSYIPSWKIFRAFAKENKIIADHVCSTEAWNKTGLSTIMDIGSGDGLVLKNILEQYKSEIKVKFVEPNEELVNDAQSHLFNFKQIEYIAKELFKLDFEKEFKNVDLFLVIHVLYLLEEKSLSKLIDQIPKDKPIIVVTDDCNSLFSDCWNITGHKYAYRSNKIHDEIENLKSTGLIKLKKTSFKTYLKNPFNVDRPDLKESLLSMVTYSEFSKLSDNSKIEISKIFDKYSEGELVECNSACYEIVKI
ncbi:MAG: class I SAM-dependent methyltransferase [Deltaproteobacteria bacterium]|nr:class I SAM-dependent methyltransferase [Deltaproteobacteria bacterium]